MLGKVERRISYGSHAVGKDTVVSLMVAGIEVRIGNQAPWVMAYETLIKVANQELLEDLSGVLNAEPKAPKAVRVVKEKPLDPVELGRRVAAVVGDGKPIGAGTIKKYLKFLGITHVGKKKHKFIYAEGTVEKLAAHAIAVRKNKSAGAAARYDKTTRRLGPKRQPAA